MRGRRGPARGRGEATELASTDTDLEFDQDGILVLMLWLAEHGVVATLSAAGEPSLMDELKWVFRAASGPSVTTDLRQSVATEEATAGQCVRIALPLLKEAGLPIGGPSWASRLKEEDCAEGTGVLVLDWLAEQGVSVFLKADGERKTPGWTLIVRGGPLPDMLRFDGPEVGRCFQRMLLTLRGQCLAVPV
ncbi:hypothetical protein YWIDRAFT_05279 [Streptomyces sp. SceaMP-e96]|uniref:hypothetical protein n=1 Tax=unclassified Streptomyces TaxID=2593676 RepID=UPI000823C643|nr:MULTISPECIES: hypothetical protein [unclassified Streptomyces]MYT15796.1 hypothetical protein [Streptomyces sp. SID4951]SCK24665.1 hypothetical protein YWIDRAFT_05279 [Streptomyces sp. SceaMP-e96]